MGSQVRTLQRAPFYLQGVYRGGLHQSLGNWAIFSFWFCLIIRTERLREAMINPPLPHLELVPRAQHGQFGDMKKMSIIAEYCRADVERAACDQ